MTITIRDHKGTLEAIQNGKITMTARHIGHGKWQINLGDTLITVDKKRRALRILEGRPDPEINPDATTALTVACPVCGSAPHILCTGPGVGGKTQEVHIGRLKVALPAPRDQAHAWLDWHDQFLTNVGSAA